MNKRGGLVLYILGLLVFTILWLGWLSGLISNMGAVAVSNGASGVDGFLLSNLNLIIFFFILAGGAYIASQTA